MDKATQQLVVEKMRCQKSEQAKAAARAKEEAAAAAKAKEQEEARKANMKWPFDGQEEATEEADVPFDDWLNSLDSIVGDAENMLGEINMSRK